MTGRGRRGGEGWRVVQILHPAALVPPLLPRLTERSERKETVHHAESFIENLKTKFSDMGSLIGVQRDTTDRKEAGATCWEKAQSHGRERQKREEKDGAVCVMCLFFSYTAAFLLALDGIVMCT
jgi:hypothetical protein